MKFCDFFAGIGGFRLGLERAGHKGIWACEIEDFPRKVYQKNFGHLPQGKDIKNVKPEDIPKADLWCGGFPCQDLSVAGKRRGLQANRSGLFWVWQRLFEARKPEWLLIENVPGLLSSNNGRDYKLLLSSLVGFQVPMPRFGRWPNAGLIRGNGLEVTWRILDAQHFGLAQRRKRLFIIRHLGKRNTAEILLERAHIQENITKKRVLVAATCTGGWGSQGNYGMYITHEGSNAIRNGEDARLPRGLDAHRYKALGNAVAMPVIEWIGRRLYEN